MNISHHDHSSFLLPLEPMGLGTEHVESIASFMSRVAILHQSSTYQLARLLALASESDSSGGKKPPKFKGRHALVSNGYGKLAEMTTAWMNFGLNRADLSSLTFLVLRDVLPEGGGSIIRANRAWCSECVLAWRNQGTPVYEKLIWSLSSATRCHTHRIALEQRCYFCGEEQSWYPAKACETPKDIFVCTHCRSDLVPNEYRPFTEGTQPDKFEQHILSVLRAKAANPDLQYDDEQIVAFLQTIEDMSSEEKSNLSVLEKRFGTTNIARIARGEKRPALKTACSIADIVGASLGEVLDDPHETAKRLILSAEFYQTPPPDKRPLRTRGKKSVLQQRIEEELELGRKEKPTALKAICNDLDISTATAYSWFPKISRQLSKLSEFWRDEAASEQQLHARKIAYSAGIARYLSEDFSTQKALVCQLVDEFGTQKTAMRNALKNAIDDWELFQNERFILSVDCATPGESAP